MSGSGADQRAGRVSAQAHNPPLRARRGGLRRACTDALVRAEPRNAVISEKRERCDPREAIERRWIGNKDAYAMAGHDRRPAPTFWTAALLAVVPVVAASVLGQLATFPNLDSWYRTLAKPPLSPPDWVFGPVWTSLYALMAYAAWRVLRRPRDEAGRSAGLALYFGQLVMNALWSWMFFAMHSPLGGLLNIVPQWLLIVATTRSFRRLDRVAGYCLVPLLGWVGFAAVLNFQIWQLNR